MAQSITTNYGHLSSPVELALAVRKRVVGNTTMYYGHVHFIRKNSHFRTKMMDDAEVVKTFVKDTTKWSRRTTSTSLTQTELHSGLSSIHQLRHCNH